LINTGEWEAGQGSRWDNKPEDFSRFRAEKKLGGAGGSALLLLMSDRGHECDPSVGHHGEAARGGGGDLAPTIDDLFGRAENRIFISFRFRGASIPRCAKLLVTRGVVRAGPQAVAGWPLSTLTTWKFVC